MRFYARQLDPMKIGVFCDRDNSQVAIVMLHRLATSDANKKLAEQLVKTMEDYTKYISKQLREEL